MILQSTVYSLYRFNTMESMPLFNVQHAQNQQTNKTSRDINDKVIPMQLNEKEHLFVSDTILIHGIAQSEAETVFFWKKKQWQQH